MLCACAAGGDLERPVYDYAQFMQGSMKMIRKNVLEPPKPEIFLRSTTASFASISSMSELNGRAFGGNSF